MRFLRGLAFLLYRLMLAFVLGWVTGLRGLLEMLRSLLARWRAQLAKPRRDRRKTDDRCVTVRHPAIQRPDPLIYSQSYLMGLGLAVTWDNPDIQLFKGGLPVPSSSLQPGTAYDLVARIWNGSTDAPVVDMPVRFTLHGFGIGTAGQPIDETTIDVLGVKGGPNCPALAKVTWTTPPIPGHYCIQAHLDWPDDLNPNNNLGQENTDVVPTSSPAQTTFRLRNDDPKRRRRYRFEVDFYSIPDREPCEEATKPSRHDGPFMHTRDVAAVGLVAVPALVRDRHSRSEHPVPAGWTVEIHPTEIVLEPHQEVGIDVVVTPPPGFHGRQRINVNAFDDVGLAGGVSLVVESV